MSDVREVVVPDVGGEDVDVIEVCVAVGDAIEAEDALLTVESDKASMDIPAPFAGTVTEILVKNGDKVSQGVVIMKVSEAASTEEPGSTEEAEPVSQNTTTEAASASERVEVTVPDIGDASDVDVIEVLVSEGDEVEEETGLITLETDKATMDVPSPQKGRVESLKVKVGDKVSQGSAVLVLAVSAGSSSEQTPEAQTPAAPQATTQTVSETSSAPSSSATSQVVDIHVPDIGDATDVDVIEVLVSAGDSVEKEAGLITLETDKATMDVPAPDDGVIESLNIAVGDKVSQGDLIGTMTVKQAASTTVASVVESKPTPSQEPAAAKAAPAASKPPPVPHHPSAGEMPKSGKIYASPSVRRLAREFGVDLTKVKGQGRKGRILKEDVQSYVKYELSRPKMTAASAVGEGAGGLQVLPAPKVDFAKFGEIEEVPLTRIQKISGPNLHRNWVTIPHVTQFDEADITELEAFRKNQNQVVQKQDLGFKITPLAFLMKAVADALRAYPVFNTSLSDDGEHIIQKKYYHIGVAVDTPKGLVVPVVRDVDKKGIYDISRELGEISVKARAGKLTATDMQGSCFSISSLGGIGGTAFTPIVNAPDVAILGVSKSETKPKWNGSEFIPRLMLPLSLSYDHRVIDGAVAARFVVHLSSVLGDIRKLIL